MIGIVVVSHSFNLAKAAIEFVSEMKFEPFKLLMCAGINNGKDFGTDPMEIKKAIEQANEGEGVIIIVDIGSSIMNTTMALEFLEDDLKSKTRIADAPFIEGLLTAVVSNTTNQTIETLLKITESSKIENKL